MRSYAQIVPTFWTRGSGKKLRGNANAQVLALYLMTAPNSNLIGLYYMPLITVCHETGLTESQVRDALADPAFREIARYDADAELAWLPECARYQIGETMAPKDKRRAAVERELAMASNHPFALEFLARYGLRFGLRTEPLTEAAEAPSKGLPENQKPPFPDPAPVIDPDPDSGSRAPTEVEPGPVVDDPRETICPLGLAEKLIGLGVHEELAASLRVDAESVAYELREFESYWVIGGGMGGKRRQWAARAREWVRRRALANELKAPGAIEHSALGGARPGVDRETQAAIVKQMETLKLMRGEV